MDVIEKIIPFDELGEMIAAFDVCDLQLHAAYYFQVDLFRKENQLTLPSTTKEGGWTLQVQPHSIELEEDSENPWLDFLKRRYSRWILVSAI